MRDLGTILEKYNGLHFKSAREKFLREHGEEIYRVKKARWLLNKLKVQLPIDGKALRRESKQLRGEVESLLPRLDEMKSEMDQLSRIRSHIRKVMPGVLEARDEEGRRTFVDYTEQQANQQELDELLQRTADQAIARGSSGDSPERPEVIQPPKRNKGAQSHDEAR